MLLFATSDKGGTGRSVTSCNVSYRLALQGHDVCYVDFDFGSPTSGAIFDVQDAVGTLDGGVHAYLRGTAAEPRRLSVWAESDREVLRSKPPAAGQLVLLPGDRGGGEFPIDAEILERCARLFVKLDEEFELVLVDLSAGRSYAIDLALAVTGRPELAGVTSRWVVFHRWTRQHIMAAAGLVYGDRGILDAGARHGHDPARLRDAVRFVRTAVLDPASPELAGLRPAQAAWLQNCDEKLRKLASDLKLGRTATLASIPLDPVLQWREQLISDIDAWSSMIANPATVESFSELAKRIVDAADWEGL